MSQQLAIHPIDLRLRNPFGIARSTVSVREVVLVRIGLGWGEASPNPYYGEDRAKVVAALEEWARYLPEDPADLLAIEDILDRIEEAHPAPYLQCAKAAVDIALHDHMARLLGVPLYRLFGRAPRADRPMVTSFTIGISDFDDMIRKAEEAREFRIIKVKTGRDLDHDIRVMTELRRRMPDHVLRVDANAGYTLDEARRAARIFADLGIEYLEQPLAKGNLEELEVLHRDCPLPIYVDEDSVVAADLPRLVGKVDGINIKLMKSGGLAEARRMLALARVHGFRVMIGCMIETSVGIAAAAALAPFADNLDLDGSLLISNDPFRGLVIAPDGTIHLSDQPGLGLAVSPEEVSIR
jgi:L-alanine-DL-glutamate epimerase-like enolase superfamily enzyme